MPNDQTVPFSIGAEYDVVVVGAGSAGVGAAAAAAAAGARTLVIERYGFAGGAATTSSVLAYCGLYANRHDAVPVVGGVGSAVMAELKSLGAETNPFRVRKTGNWIVSLNPEALKVALDRTLGKAGVSVLFHAAVCAARRDGTRMTEIQVTGHFGTRLIRANAFVDASGEADLCAFAGLRLAGPQTMQPASFPMRIGGVGAGWQIERTAFQVAVTRYNATGPVIPARADGGVVIAMPNSSEIWWMALDFPVDACNGADFSRKEALARDAAWRLTQELRQADPTCRAAYLASSGPQIGIRESRHSLTRATVSEADVTSGAVPADTVALGGWPIEIHHAPGVHEYVPVGGDGYFGIPLGALRVPGVDNVLVAGRLVGADCRAYGSTRVMGTAFATGQAAGVFAAACADAGQVPEASAIKRRLLQQGALLALD